MPSYTLLAASLLLALACSRDSGSVTTAHAEGESARTALRPSPDVRLPNIVATGYQVAPVTDGGSITGTIDVDGAAPTDSSIVPPEEIQRQCKPSFVDETIALQGAHLGGAVVWLEGVRRGKDFPPIRRYEVQVTGCRLVPRAQPVFAGGTLHVHSEDRLNTLVRVLRWPGGDVAATVSTNDEGQVVPDDRVLAKVGALEVKGTQPPWLRAWVLVFDHPYATSSSPVGAFTLDSVPAGQYTLVAWHERFGQVSQPVTVTAGQATRTLVRFSGADTTRAEGRRQ